MAQSQKSLLKRVSDYIRREYYYRTTAKNFNFAGLPIELPETIHWDVLKQLVRGTYEDAERQLISRYLDPKIPVVELGGSIGVVSAFLRSRLDPQTPLIVVEANPRVLSLCERNALRGDTENVTQVLLGAITYDKDVVEFEISDDSLSNRIGTGKASEVAKVPTISLSEVGGDFEEFSLVMDIEGAEFDLIERETKILRNCRLMIAEIHPHYFPGDQNRSKESFLASANAAGLNLAGEMDNVLVLTRDRP